MDAGVREVLQFYFKDFTFDFILIFVSQYHLMTIDQLIQKVTQLNKEGEKDKLKYQKVIDLLPDELLEREKSDTLLAEKSQAYFRLKKYEECKRAADLAIEINPKNKKALLYMGGYYYSYKKDNKKAEESYKKIIDLDPDYPYAYNGLGHLYRDQKDYKKAEDFYNKAIEINPFYHNPYNELGNLYLDQKDYKKAEDFYYKTIEINPDYSHAHYGLGNIYRHQNEYLKAEEYYKKAIERDPDFYYPYISLGVLYSDQKEYLKAEEYYKKAIEIDPENSYPYHGLGVLYSDQKEYLKAEEYYKLAIKKEADFGGFYYNLGLLYYLDIKPRQLEKAKENFEKKIILSKANSDEFTERAISFVKEIDDILNSPELNKIVSSKDKIRSILKFKDGEISHFTSLSTVKFLIKDSSPFRLSEATFLNDSSEGKTIFDFLDYHQESNNNFGHEYYFAKKPFIGSFVHASKHNDLALWRLYGKEGSEEGKGCSITLNSTVFLKIIKDNASEATKQNFDNEFQLYKVAYWDNKEEFLVDNKMNPTLKKAMQELKKSVESFKNKKNRAPEEDLNVQEALNEIAYLFKNQEYQYENEIRLVIKDPFGYKKHLTFDSTNLTTKVYIELCQIQKCISSISIGPKTPNKDDWAAYFHYYFEQLSDTEKMAQVKILISTLPYK